MDRHAHPFLAARAVALLAEDPETRSLADLLKPHLPAVALGAWLPDEKFFKSGSGDTQNHVLKMGEYSGPNKERFIVSRKQLLEHFNDRYKIHGLLKDPTRLPLGWWDKPYRGDCPRGEHPANCAMGLATTLIDLLLLGDREIQQALPGIVGDRADVPAMARTSGVQASLYFFMMSHPIADAHMFCHADARRLASYKGNLHKKFEKHISAQLKHFPSPDELQGLRPQEILKQAVAAFPLDFRRELSRPGTDGIVIPELKNGFDAWKEVIWICRASFAVSCIIAPPDKYALAKADKSRKDEGDLPADAPLPSFKELFEGRQALLEEVTTATIHDAVLNVARLWKNVWQTVTRLRPPK